MSAYINTTKLTAAVKFVDATIPEKVLTDQEISLSLVGMYNHPYYKHGLWMIMDISGPELGLEWKSKHYLDGVENINTTVLPPLNPVVTIALQKPQPPIITFQKFSKGDVGQYYETLVTVDGGKKPYIYSAKNLPLGLKINARTGIISGYPIVKDRVYVTLSIVDANRNRVEIEKRITIRE